MGIRVAHTQLSIVIATATVVGVGSGTKYLAVLDIEAIVVTNHLAASLNRDGALHAASVIVV